MHTTNALFRLAFAPAPPFNGLTIRSAHKVTGSFFNRHAVTVRRPLRLLVSIRFQFYFTPLTGVLFTFPSRYWFTIGICVYLAFPVSSGRFTQAIHVPGYSGTTEERCIVFVYGTITLCGRAFQRVPLTTHFVTFPCRCRQDSIVLLPHICQRQMQFGLLPFRSPLLREL